MMKWKFHPGASEEYLEATRHYTGIDQKLGLAFVQCVEFGIQQITETPLCWREIEEDIRRYLITRFPFGIYYTIEDEFILVVSVMHMKRRPFYWRERTKRSRHKTPKAEHRASA